MTRTLLLLLLVSVLLIYPHHCSGDTLWVDLHLSDCYSTQALEGVLLYIEYFNCTELKWEYLLKTRPTDELGRIQIPFEMSSLLKRPIQITTEMDGYLPKSDTFVLEVGKPITMCLEPKEPIKVTGTVKNYVDNSPLDRVRIMYGLKAWRTATSTSETYTDTLGNFKWVFGIDYLNKTIKYHFSKQGFESHKGEITLKRENQLPIYLNPNNSVHSEGSLWKDLKIFIPAFAVTLGSFIYLTYYKDKD